MSGVRGFNMSVTTFFFASGTPYHWITAQGSGMEVEGEERGGEGRSMGQKVGTQKGGCPGDGPTIRSFFPSPTKMSLFFNLFGRLLVDLLMVFEGWSTRTWTLRQKEQHWRRETDKQCENAGPVHLKTPSQHSTKTRVKP